MSPEAEADDPHADYKEHSRPIAGIGDESAWGWGDREVATWRLNQAGEALRANCTCLAT